MAGSAAQTSSVAGTGVAAFGATEVPERIRYTVVGLQRRMASIRAAGPVDHALAAGLLAVDVSDAYRSAVHAGDEVAATELRGMLSGARRLATAHLWGEGGPSEFGLPTDPAVRVRTIAGQLRLVELYRISLTASRNLAAAGMVERAGWSAATVAALARTDASKVLAAIPAVRARHDVDADADPGTVVELSDLIDALAGRGRALGRLRDETIRGLLRAGRPSRVVAALGQVPTAYVAALSTMDRISPPPQRTGARR